MKKFITIIIITLLLSLLAVGTVFAEKGKVNLKGEVISVDVAAGKVTVQSNKGGVYLVTPPAGVDLLTIQVGDEVLVKGFMADDGTLTAHFFKRVGKPAGDKPPKPGQPDLEDEDQPEGSKANSAYCMEGKQDRPHPLATKMAARYGVTTDWVMGYFCQGYSMGAIMLALKTSQIEGIDAGPDTLLADRGEGISWGHIWQNLGLIGSQKEGHSPPGQLKKLDKGGPKDKD